MFALNSVSNFVVIINTMSKLVVLVAICLVGNMAMIMTSVLDKPYYDLENAEDLFHDFAKQHGKSYSSKEYFERLEIFKENLQDINHRNAVYPETVFAVNHFVDLNPEERQRYYGFKLSNETRVKVTIPNSLVDLPTEFDWRDKGVVSHVKNQHRCGSCFIFSAIGNIEGQYAMKHNQCLALSEQQALNCLDCGTCDGGYSADVMVEFAEKAGVMKEEDYPYTGKEDTCHEDTKKGVVHVLRGEEIDIPDEDTLMQKLVEIGPLAVSLAAQDLDFYKEGILYPNLCKGHSHNHAALLVGYGEEKNATKYWIVKNSWGEKWGEKGYFRLLRGVDACVMGTSFTASATVA